MVLGTSIESSIRILTLLRFRLQMAECKLNCILKNMMQIWVKSEENSWNLINIINEVRQSASSTFVTWASIFFYTDTYYQWHYEHSIAHFADQVSVERQKSIYHILNLAAHLCPYFSSQCQHYVANFALIYLLIEVFPHDKSTTSAHGGFAMRLFHEYKSISRRANQISILANKFVFISLTYDYYYQWKNKLNKF